MIQNPKFLLPISAFIYQTEFFPHLSQTLQTAAPLKVKLMAPFHVCALTFTV